MKKLIAFIFVAFISNITLATYKKGITTEEEYLYMSKGYKIAQESGLDIKSGYAIGNSFSYTSTIYTFEYKTFLKVSGTDTAEVGQIVKVTAKYVFGTTIYWFGIPVGNQTILDQFFTSLYAPSNESLVRPFFKSYAALKEVGK